MQVVIKLKSALPSPKWLANMENTTVMDQQSFLHVAKKSVSYGTFLNTGKGCHNGPLSFILFHLQVQMLDSTISTMQEVDSSVRNANPNSLCLEIYTSCL